MGEVVTKNDLIAGKINQDVTGTMAVTSDSGGLSFENLPQVLEFAKVMAVADIGVRKHLRGNVGACAAITMQAIEWRMSPFAVANKSYLVNDQIAYEASLIHAVILLRAPISGRPKSVYKGTGPTRQLLVRAELRDEPGEWVEYESPLFDRIQPKNSPLWKNDPDQQLWYFSIRAWCRRHFPDVILGVYTDDELPDDRHQGPSRAKNVTPATASNLAGRLEPLAGGRVDFNPPEEKKPKLDHDPDTGEVIEDERDLAGDDEGGGSDASTEGEKEEATEAQGGGDAQGGGSSQDDGDTADEKPTLIDIARGKANVGGGTWKRFKGGLTVEQAKELEPHMKGLEELAGKPAVKGGAS